MSRLRSLRCRPGARWVKDLGRVVVVDPEAQRSWLLEGQEMELWELLQLGYSLERAAAALAIVHGTGQEEMRRSLERILARWAQAGLLEGGQGG